MIHCGRWAQDGSRYRVIVQTQKSRGSMPRLFCYPLIVFKKMAGRTGIEPVTSDVTGRRSNQLNYHPKNEL